MTEKQEQPPGEPALKPHSTSPSMPGPNEKGCDAEALVVENADDGDGHTCVSSVTGFDFDLYPASGMIYPALETVPSDVSNFPATRPGANPVPASQRKEANYVAASAAAKADAEIPSTLESKAAKVEATQNKQESNRTVENPNEMSPSLRPLTAGQLSNLPAGRPYDSFPGAFNVRPGGASAGGDDVTIHSDGAGETSTEFQAISHQHHNNDNNNNNGQTPQDGLTSLAIANPVEEDSSMLDIPRAEPADNLTQTDPKGCTQQAKDAKAHRVTLLVCMAVILVVAIVISVVISQKDNHIEMQTIQPSTMAPSSNNMTVTVPETPSGPLDLLLDRLPNSTLENIQIYNTPQWLAYDWLLHYPNVTNLEEWRKTQLFALASFYYAMEGPNWRKEVSDNFLVYDQYGYEKPEECYWFSSLFGRWSTDGAYSQADERLSMRKPCNENGEFVQIFFSNLELANYTLALPPEVALLSSLEWLLFSHSGFKGNLDEFLPSELYQMESLTSLYINENDLTGTIPTELGLMTNLRDLALNSNPLQGTIPTELGSLTNVGNLWLSAAGLHGSIPDELANLTMIKQLDLSINDLTGSTPSWFGLMPNMTHLKIHSNKLDGSIPSELGLLNLLVNLTLRDNALTGSIPEWIWSIESVVGLELQGNHFHGKIPSEIGLLTKLGKLDLSNLPQLSGRIPAELGLLAGNMLGALKLVGSSGLSGTIPEELCYLQNSSCQLFDFWWYQNTSCFLELDCTVLCGCHCNCTE